MKFGAENHNCVLKFHRVGRRSNIVVTYGRIKLPDGNFMYLNNAVRCDTTSTAFVKQFGRLLVVQNNDKNLYAFLKEKYPEVLEGIDSYNDFHSMLLNELSTQYKSAVTPRPTTITRCNAVLCPKLHNNVAKARYEEFKNSKNKI